VLESAVTKRRNKCAGSLGHRSLRFIQGGAM
jgi:hypothetical protein